MFPGNSVFSFFFAIGRIPVTSNFPTFHITPLNLILPPPSVATTSSGNDAVESVLVNPTPPQSTLVLNIMLQQLGMMPANVQMSADNVHRSAFICQGAERVSPVPVSVGLQQVTVLLRDYQDLHGELVPTTPQEVRRFFSKILSNWDSANLFKDSQKCIQIIL